MNGINIFNPIEIAKEYYLKVIDYAIKNRIDFFQINGPIHNPIKGNIDGMTFYRKYAQFNESKDEEYVKNTIKKNYYSMTILRPGVLDPVPLFVEEIQASFYKERETSQHLKKEGLTDFIVCGGGNEGHKLQKEVNFSDTYIFEDGVSLNSISKWRARVLPSFKDYYAEHGKMPPILR